MLKLKLSDEMQQGKDVIGMSLNLICIELTLIWHTYKHLERYWEKERERKRKKERKWESKKVRKKSYSTRLVKTSFKINRGGTVQWDPVRFLGGCL